MCPQLVCSCSRPSLVSSRRCRFSGGRSKRRVHDYAGSLASPSAPTTIGGIVSRGILSLSGWRRTAPALCADPNIPNAVAACRTKSPMSIATCFLFTRLSPLAQTYHAVFGVLSAELRLATDLPV